MAVLEITPQNFDNEVTNSPIPVLLDFWAPWCGPCRMVGPVVEEIANENMGVVKVCKVNVDEAPDLAAKFGVMSIPLLVVMKNGNVSAQAVGALPKADILKLIEQE